MAILVATTVPGPDTSEYTPDKSVNTPILTMPSETWACAVVANVTRARLAALAM